MKLLVGALTILMLEGQVFCEDASAVGLLGEIYDSCLQHGSVSCVKPKVLGFYKASLLQDKIALTDDLCVVRKAGASEEGQGDAILPEDLPQVDDDRQKTIRFLMLDRIDNFLSEHELRVRVPKELVTGEMLPMVPKFLLHNIPPEVRLPLAEPKESEGRGFVKKVLIPFLLGLKFKATALIPLAIALIALKTWKALTLGLLSMVLSGAMVIFRFAKPKVVNYEVYHYPSHPPAPPMMEHPASYGEHHGYGRSDSQGLAYSAYQP